MRIRCAWPAVVVCAMSAHFAAAAGVFLRCKVHEPASGTQRVELGGYCHETPWQLFPLAKIEVAAGHWSEWLDVGKQKWPLHGRHNRAGGVAEWPALRMTVDGAKGCAIEVQIPECAAGFPARGGRRRGAAEGLQGVVHRRLVHQPSRVGGIDQWVKAGGVVHLSAGAATRDEFYEPYVPPFAASAWPADAVTAMVKESHAYNERVDLPTIKPMATIRIDGAELPVIGCRLNLRGEADRPIAQVTHGNGKVIAFSFLPMLAYGQLAGFKPETLEEKWPDAPRRLIELALKAANVTSVAKCDHEVVETSLLTGEKGSALVLVNYTYQPIESLAVDVKLPNPVKRAVSTEGRDVAIEQIPGGARLRMPLEWTDIVLLE
jgi:hypothetical protein